MGLQRAVGATRKQKRTERIVMIVIEMQTDGSLKTLTSKSKWQELIESVTTEGFDWEIIPTVRQVSATVAQPPKGSINGQS